VLTTWYALIYLGLHEGNPILSPIFQRVGLIIGLITIKLLILMVMYALICKIPVNVKFRVIDGKNAATNIICIMYFFVVGNNLYMINVL